jgi:hypothetical protein
MRITIGVILTFIFHGFFALPGYSQACARSEGMAAIPFSINNDEAVRFDPSDISEWESVSDDNSSGILKVISGTVLVPLGGLLMLSSSFEKCEESDGILTGGFGPCSKSGPSKQGRIIGLTISVSGLILLFSGILDLSN